MKRREFITVCVGGAAAWPLAAHAQHSTGRPLVGLLNPLSAAAAAHIVRPAECDLDYLEGATAWWHAPTNIGQKLVRRVRYV